MSPARAEPGSSSGPASELAVSFGLAVRRNREHRGWSQEQLAEHADLNRSYVGELERGQAVASLHTVGKIAQALDLSLSGLIAQTEALSSSRLVNGIELTSIAC